MSRKEFAQVVMIKNAGQFGLGIFAWWVVGFAFAFGEADTGFLGTKYWAGDQWRGSSLPTVATLIGLVGISVLYIINGTIAERTNLIPYCCFTFMIMIFTWPVVVSWAWGGGWLADMGQPFEDVGGAATVHVFAGTFALVGALIIGKRAGRWEAQSQAPAFKFSSPPLLAVGSLLYFIHLCFLNSLMATTLIQRGMAVFNTWLCAGTVALVTTLFGTLSNQDVEWHFVTVFRGFIGGAVLVSGVAWNIDGWAAFTFGVFGGLFLIASMWLVNWLRIDDVTFNISVHFTMGLAGCFGVGLWDNSRGGFHNNDGELIGSQLGGELAIMAWSAVFAIGVFGLCKLLNIHRVPESVQVEGFNNACVCLSKGFISTDMQVIPNRESQAPDNISKSVNAETELAGRMHDSTIPRADS